MAYTLQQIFEALGKIENGGSMVADFRPRSAKYAVKRPIIASLGTRCWTPLACVMAIMSTILSKI